ncbi:MAG: NAD(P)H-dependent oxidoreductase [Marinisporobacter sp.]|jgi:flavodoxin|nr:NAD(P)H-dependent oxidoreductase [Marinisporobacter sp.]
MTDKKAIVIYYSLQGNTKKLGNIITDQINADVLELQLQKPYNLATAATIGLAHIKSGHTPALKQYALNLADYNYIFIGTPVWWYTITPPVSTFLQQNNFKGKKVILFSTHAGNNGKTFEVMKNHLEGAEIIGQKDFYKVNKQNLEALKKDAQALLTFFK